MSGKTTKLELPYPAEGESADVPRDIKALAERAETVLGGTAGQLLVAKSTGAPVPKTLKGDATLAEDGTLTLGQLPACRVLNAADTELSSEVIPWGSEAFDNGGMHSTASNTSRITAFREGVYLIAALFADYSGFEAATSLTVKFRLNGTTVIHRSGNPGGSGENRAVAASTIYKMAAGDYVEMLAISGGLKPKKVGAESYFAAALLSA